MSSTLAGKHFSGSCKSFEFRNGEEFALQFRRTVMQKMDIIIPHLVVGGGDPSFDNKNN